MYADGKIKIIYPLKFGSESVALVYNLFGKCIPHLSQEATNLMIDSLTKSIYTNSLYCKATVIMYFEIFCWSNYVTVDDRVL